MIKKATHFKKSMEKFPVGVEKEKYELVEKSVEKFSSQLNMFGLIDVGH